VLLGVILAEDLLALTEAFRSSLFDIDPFSLVAKDTPAGLRSSLPRACGGLNGCSA
jgi:hypothetical protein